MACVKEGLYNDHMDETQLVNMARDNKPNSKKVLGAGGKTRRFNGGRRNIVMLQEDGVLS